MRRFFSWILSHKLVTLLALVILLLLFRNSSPVSLLKTMEIAPSYDTSYDSAIGMPAPGGGSVSMKSYAPSVLRQEAAPVTGVDRMGVQNSYISLLVKNVSETLSQIK